MAEDRYPNRGIRRTSQALGDRVLFRAQLLRTLRSYFDDLGFVEVDPPVRIRAPAPEPWIDAIPVPGGYLRTSPELQMKRLLARGLQKIYCLGPCFRDGERTPKHREEFCLLEWYRSGESVFELMNDLEALFPRVAESLFGTTRLSYQGQELDLAQPERLSVRDAFSKFAPDVDPDTATDETWSETLGLHVEPHLGRRGPTLLTDYPLRQGALAKVSSRDPTTVERVEAYVCGLELANGWSELTDPVEQRLRFEEDRGRRSSRGKDPYPLDEAFLNDLGRLQAAAGIALGVDRLAMILMDAGDIGDVLPFGELP